MRRNISVVGLGLGALALVVIACGGASDDPAKTPSGARASCSSDSDCVVTNEGGCCAACPDAPHAIPKLSYEQYKNKCAATSCMAASDRIECPKVDPVEGYVAKCNKGTCAAVKAKP